MISSGMITISCGGGGIPVIYEEDRIEGIAAVIDKDFAAEKLAEVIDADILLILTAVDKICVNYNKFNQKEISNINIDKLNEYIEEGQFAPGSMLPKVEAAKKFVQFDKNKIAIIASLSKAMEALNETSGTRIVR
ncbi:Carbamate kinase 1 [bioreactor metagenome]|uniref:Carbamate kinase 1 n=2 Tax=root TaxID=1 RepID=A0A645J5V0_9ZZZZ